jgi:secreted trypsin-like serine protease
MRRVVTKFVWLVVMTIGVCAAPAAAVTDGEHDGSRHPNVGALLIGTPGVDMFQLCSGSLIAPDEFLTAGHCTDFLETNAAPGDVSASFEELLEPNPDTGVLSPATTIAVSGWSTMPGFKGSVAKAVNDVGVVHLARPVTGIQPVALPSAGFLDVAQAGGLLNGHVFTNVGYGLNGLDRSITSKQVAVSWEARRMQSTSRFKSLTPNYLKQQGGICFGDSGGPHFWDGTGPLSNLTVAVTAATNPNCGTLAENQRLDTPDAVAFLAAFAP